MEDEAFDKYLNKYYGFTTKDGKWRRMSNQGKILLRDSYKLDTAKAEQKTQVATLYTGK